MEQDIIHNNKVIKRIKLWTRSAMKNWAFPLTFKTQTSIISISFFTLATEPFFITSHENHEWSTCWNSTIWALPRTGLLLRRRCSSVKSSWISGCFGFWCSLFCGYGTYNFVVELSLISLFCLFFSQTCCLFFSLLMFCGLQSGLAYLLLNSFDGIDWSQSHRRGLCFLTSTLVPKVTSPVNSPPLFCIGNKDPWHRNLSPISQLSLLSPIWSFSTAGRMIKTGLTASVIVSQWTWAATLLQSSNVAWAYGVSGPFWYVICPCARKLVSFFSWAFSLFWLPVFVFILGDKGMRQVQPFKFCCLECWLFVSRRLLLPLILSLKLYMQDGEQRPIWHSCSSASVPTLLWPVCFCWVVQRLLKRWLVWIIDLLLSWFRGVLSFTRPLVDYKRHSWLLTFTLSSFTPSWLQWSFSLCQVLFEWSNLCLLG